MTTEETLKQFGFNTYFEQKRTDLGVDLNQLARITTEHKGAYELISAQGEYRAVVTGKRMLTASTRDEYPAVGDWVVIQNDTNTTKVIDDILPRQSVLRKKYAGKDATQLIAANIDVLFIVESVDRDYNLNRFERYIVLAKEGGVKPVIILNKCDLHRQDELDRYVEEISIRFPNINVLLTSTINESGLEQLNSFIQPGVTYCFVGSSGVGKSSLINQLLEKDNIKTGEIGEKTNRGKHTTTARAMYFMESGGIIIDNPGSREVGVTNSNTGIKEVFIDIENLAVKCKFSNCTHTDEPGCAVKEAMEAGEIDSAQYENYKKVQKEAQHFEMSEYAKRQKDRKFGQFLKKAKRDFE